MTTQEKFNRLDRAMTILIQASSANLWDGCDIMNCIEGLNEIKIDLADNLNMEKAEEG